MGGSILLQSDNPIRLLKICFNFSYVFLGGVLVRLRISIGRIVLKSKLLKMLFPCISPRFSLKYSSNRAQNAHNTHVQGELKAGKLYFLNNSSILGFLRNE